MCAYMWVYIHEMAWTLNVLIIPPPKVKSIFSDVVLQWLNLNTRVSQKPQQSFDLGRSWHQIEKRQRARALK